MRKIFVKGLACIVTFALTVAGASAVQAAEIKTADRTIHRLTVPPTVDGVITAGEWGVADMLLVNYQTFTVTEKAQKMPLDGEVYFGWDDTHFYLGVTARYETHRNPYSGWEVWRGNSLQMQIATADGERHAFCFALNDDGVAHGYLAGEETYTQRDVGGEFFVRRDEESRTTYYEIALPLAQFGGTAPLCEGDSLRFSYAMRMWNGFGYEWCGGILKEENIEKAATLTLGGDKKTTFTEKLLNGDVDQNGRVDSTDARLVLQYAVKKIGAQALDLRTADADGNGSVNSTDARLILQYAVKKISTLPAGNILEVVTNETMHDSRTISQNTFAPTDERAGQPIYTLTDLVPKEAEVGAAVFGYFAFLMRDNEQLPFSFQCHDGGDTLTAMVPAGVDVSALIPTFHYYGEAVLVNERPLVSGETVLNLTAAVSLTLVPTQGESRTVTLRVETLDTGLPSVALSTADYMEITSKKDYVNTTFYLGGGDAAEPMLVTSRAKGRGNSTWGHLKKSYTVKLDKKATLLDMSESKDWALVANYEDKSLLRNLAAQYLAEGTGQAWVPKRRPVDLWYNGKYWGTYDLVEKIEVESDRVNIAEFQEGMAAGESGYLMEFDFRVAQVSDEQRAAWLTPLGEGYPVYYDTVSDVLFMQVPSSEAWLSIKEPKYEDVEARSQHLLYIYNKVATAVEALQSGNYAAIAECLDIPSFCQWYLVESFMNNCDSEFHSSCYMTLDASGKLTMGPIWDFDRSSENCYYWNSEEDPYYLYRHEKTWFPMLFAVAECREILKQEYVAFRERMQELPLYIETVADSLYAAQTYNFMRWSILGMMVVAVPPEEVSNTVVLSIKAAKVYEAEIARLNAYFTRMAAKMEAFITGL